MSGQRKTIMSIIAIIIIIIVSVVGIMKIMDKGYKNEEIKVNKEFKITFQYLSELEEEYSMKFGEEKVLIKTSDISPSVNTSVLGETKHTININDEEVILNIMIEDLRGLRLTGTPELQIPQGTDERELERIMLNDLQIEDVEYRGDIQIDFIYSDKFDLEKTGVMGQVTVIAHYKDNEYNKDEFRYTITREVKQAASKPEKEEKVEMVQTGETTRPVAKPAQRPSERPKENIIEKPINRPIEKPIQRPVQKPRPQTKPVKPKNEAQYPLKYPELLPEGAVLIYSSIRPHMEEFHEYSIRRDYEDGSYIKTAHITFNENFPYSVRLIGQDSLGEILSLNYIINNKSIEYDWQTATTIAEEELKIIAHQFAKAYGFN